MLNEFIVVITQTRYIEVSLVCRVWLTTFNTTHDNIDNIDMHFERKKKTYDCNF